MSGALAHDYAVKQAADKGLIVRYPGPRELFVDIDDAEGLARYEAGLQILDDNGWLYAVRCSPSPSGRPGRYHIVVTVHRDLTALERVALQAALGSDPKREILAILKLEYEGDKPCTMFFEKPE